MSCYKVNVSVYDEPASFVAEVIVIADTKGKALRLARKAAIDSYYERANGWASKPVIEDISARPFTLPTSGVISVSGQL